jgi:hypothetical protein
MKPYNLPIRDNPLRTRAEVQQAFRQLCEPLKPCYSQGSARLHLGNTGAGFSDAIAQMEGFSRVLWGLVPLLAGGGDSDLLDIYVTGIKHGTDPEHEEYWGELNDFDQRLVEMAAFGFALALVPDKLWAPLTAAEKRNVVNWLNQINRLQLYDCNWLLFLVLVNLGLKRVGAPYDKERMERNLRRIDDFYLSDGWYSDGVNGYCDYYGPIAIHFFCLVYAKLMGSEDPERAERYKQRASAFAKAFIYWFAGDGSALPYGRSLTYRFAQAAFWSALVYAEAEPFPLGVLKGLILRNLRWWFQRPIFHRDGTLTIGYAYPNLVMAENYNSPGSPYWAFKTFLPLALPEEHPFWQAEELPLPKLNETSVQLPAHLVIQRQTESNHVIAFNSGHPSTNEHTHSSAKYEKFAYSNFFGFSVPRAEWGLGQGAFDSMLAFSEGDNLYRVKRQCVQHRIDGDTLYVKWRPWTDVTVDTWLLTGSPWHVRVHRIDSRRTLNAADGGFALGLEAEDGKEYDKTVHESDHGLLVQHAAGASGVICLYGNGRTELVTPNANTNIMNPRTVIPTVRADVNPGITWLVTAVFGEPGKAKVNEHWADAPSVRVDKDTISVYAPASKRILFQTAVGDR